MIYNLDKRKSDKSIKLNCIEKKRGILYHV